jgi:hypothetical protein
MNNPKGESAKPRSRRWATAALTWSVLMGLAVGSVLMVWVQQKLHGLGYLLYAVFLGFAFFIITRLPLDPADPAP